MNTHARNPRYKLTAVSIYYRGQRRTWFCNLPLDDAGKVYVPLALYASIPRGATFCIGG